MHKGNLIKGNDKQCIDTNVKTLMANGYSEPNATRVALRYAKRGKTADRVVKGVTAKPRSNKVKIL